MKGVHLGQILQLSLPFLAGLIIGCCLIWIFYRIKIGEFQRHASQILYKAEEEAKLIHKNSAWEISVKEIEQQRELEQLWQTERKKIWEEEERLQRREDKLESRMNLVEKKLSDIEKKEIILHKRRERLQEEQKLTEEKAADLISRLEKIAGISPLQAKEILLEKVKQDVKADAAQLTRSIKQEAEEEADKKATKIIATAINRMAVSCVSETTTCTVHLPQEEMKGRIIGREGRNIRALENATGVNFIVDDTPKAVIISGFDPIRKHIAKLTLQELVLDGRIHPSRIEEVVEEKSKIVDKLVKEFGEDAAYESGVMNLHPELIKLMGQLKFRYSLGQNVLEHSIEVSHILGMIAAELNLDIQRAKRIGFLHDMGKALSHKIEGTHALIGQKMALKYGESIEVANGIGCHHNEIPASTIEGSLCGAADAISGARPGARIEAVDQYIKRLKDLEALSQSFPGVEKAYALQAGREVRVIVSPDTVNDDEITNLSRDLAQLIKEKLIYPGRIKITVIRETRVIDYAT